MAFILLLYVCLCPDEHVGALFLALFWFSLCFSPAFCFDRVENQSHASWPTDGQDQHKAKTSTPRSPLLSPNGSEQWP